MSQVPSSLSQASKDLLTRSRAGGADGSQVPKATVGGEAGARAWSQVLEGTPKREVSSPEGHRGGLGSAVPGASHPSHVLRVGWSFLFMGFCISQICT